MRRLYSALLLLALPFAVAALLWRGLRDRAYWRHLGERFGFGPALGSSGALWLHAVSLGEVTAAAPLVRALRAAHPHTPLVLTTATPTGRARALELFGGAVDVRFLPYDTGGSMRRLLERIRPRLAVVMETELWPNLYHACRMRGVPIVLASARISAKSVRRYRRFGGLFRDALSAAAVIAAQTPEDASRFEAVGAPGGALHVVGNLKFDSPPAADAAARGRALRAALWGERATWVAGSTHAGEEEMALGAHGRLEAHRPGALLLLVPRHPQRFAAVAELLARRGLRFQRRSAGEAVRPDTQVLLVDTVGELAALYAAADVAFVGGSLVPVGGHNLLEPAALGLAVLTGPYTANAADVARQLLARGGAIRVEDEAALGAALCRLIDEPQARRRMGAAAQAMIEANRGALGRLLELIGPLAGPAVRQ